MIFFCFVLMFTQGVKLREEGDDLTQNNQWHLRIFSTLQWVRLWDLVELFLLPYWSKISLKVVINKISKCRFSISEKKYINLSFLLHQGNQHFAERGSAGEKTLGNSGRGWKYEFQHLCVRAWLTWPTSPPIEYPIFGSMKHELLNRSLELCTTHTAIMASLRGQRGIWLKQEEWVRLSVWFCSGSQPCLLISPEPHCLFLYATHSS